MFKKTSGTSLAVGLVALLFAAPAQAQDFTPDRPECLAPTSPGGGWDFTCRSFARTLEELDLIASPMQTVNMPGAGGAVGFSHVLEQREGEDDLVIAASTGTLNGFAQGTYPGNPDDVRWIGTLGADFGVIAVGNDSPYETLEDLLSAMAEDADSVAFTGGSGVGGWDHFKLLILANSAGIEDLRSIPWLASSNSGEALSQVVGGHIPVFSGDLSEAAGFLASGDVRILAVLSPERLEGKLAEIPTAVEQGYDAVGANWRGFYMPAETSDEAYDFWVRSLDTVAESDAWAKVMAENGLGAYHISGDEFETMVREQLKTVVGLAQEIGLTQ